MEHADRVWVSDCIDAHERHRLVRWTGLTLPPELMGTHVGSGVDHTTGRRLDLDFRAGTALWGHLGVEWDLTSADDADLARLRAWISLHKELRDLLHSGRVVNADPSTQHSTSRAWWPRTAARRSIGSLRWTTVSLRAPASSPFRVSIPSVPTGSRP